MKKIMELTEDEQTKVNNLFKVMTRMRYALCEAMEISGDTSQAFWDFITSLRPDSTGHGATIQIKPSGDIEVIIDYGQKVSISRRIK